MNAAPAAVVERHAVTHGSAEAHARCPSCGSDDNVRVLELPDVPVHSTRLLRDRSSALAIDRGRVDLVWCRTCDFIANVAFDPTAVDYTVDGYEDSQASSPTFVAFARDLADHLVERYSLHGGCVVEVGSGKGDFLDLLAERGSLAGIGIDPASPVERSARTCGAGRVHLRREWLAPIHARIPFDLLCCRHTLEHVPDVNGFLRVVHGVVSARRIPVYLEVPDVTRILDEGAFWDVYHEHCSYFCARSLAHLFDRHGFAVTDLHRTYGEQYLSCEAEPRPLLGPGARPPDEPEETLAGSVARFVETVDAVRARWRATFAQAAARGERVVLWGAGSKAVGFLTAVPGASRARAVVDIDPRKQGRFLPGSGLEVMAPDALTALDPELIVVLNPLYRQEIARLVDERGVRSRIESV